MSIRKKVLNVVCVVAINVVVFVFLLPSIVSDLSVLRAIEAVFVVSATVWTDYRLYKELTK